MSFALGRIFFFFKVVPHASTLLHQASIERQPRHLGKSREHCFGEVHFDVSLKRQLGVVVEEVS